jgi:hypothetical protein
MTALIGALLQLLVIAGAAFREHRKSRDRSDGRLANELHDIETEVGAKDDDRTQQELRDILGG